MNIDVNDVNLNNHMGYTNQNTYNNYNHAQYGKENYNRGNDMGRN